VKLISKTKDLSEMAIYEKLDEWEMRTYLDSNAGSQIEQVLWNAKESVWIISPWIGKNYAERLASLSQKGIEVRIVTSNVDYNGESLEVFKASENPKLMLLVLDKEKAAFIHSKIYLVDKLHAISGSANLTYSGLNKNVESLNIAKTNEEVQQIEMDFMRTWMKFERKSMSNEEL
jgi:phosphatidylserine/phosphatidylglycerophosphate/cardiolipin synthase-like enzyme